MNEVLDPNTIAAKAATELVSSVLEGVSARSKQLSNSALDRLKVAFNTCFKSFLAMQYDQYYQIKPIVSPLIPVNIEDVFEGPNLSINKTRSRYPSEEGISFEQFETVLQENRRVVVTAIAGSGKSVMLKQMFIRMFKRRDGTLPIFIELRHLNEITETDLLTYLYAQMLAAHKSFTREQFELALRHGKFCFLLDGYDELRPELRDNIRKQILSIEQKYRKNQIVVTSRPDDEFLSWPKYTEYFVHPFSKEQAISLIGKMPFDSGVKSKLIARVKGDLYKTHRDFLSNPLLASMMLLTFESSYDIPSKRHIFFRRAFQALLEKHDAAKKFKRVFKTGLDHDDFEKAFSAFCVYSYLEREFSFSDTTAEKYANFAFHLLGIELSGKELIHDLVKCVCMLVKDGDRYSFLHRSFQEYFAACFIISHAQEKAQKILKRCIETSSFPMAAARLAFDIDPHFVETEYIQPRLTSLIAKLEEHQGDYESQFFLMFESLSQHRHDSDLTTYTLVIRPDSHGLAPAYIFLLECYFRSKTTEVYFPDNWSIAVGTGAVEDRKINNSAHAKKEFGKIIRSLKKIQTLIVKRTKEREDLVDLLT